MVVCWKGIMGIGMLGGRVGSLDVVRCWVHYEKLRYGWIGESRVRS